MHALDFKGFGENKGMEKPYSLDDYVFDLKKYIDDNGLNKPCVIAHSFGARVVLKTEYLYPETFEKIVLTGGAGLKPRKSFKRTLKRVLFKVLKKVLPRKYLRRLYSPDYLVLDDVMKKSFVKIVGEHLDYTLSSIKTPTLIVCGNKDKDTPLYMAKRLNKGLPNSKLLIIKGAGHFAFLDKPFKFNTEVKEFLLSK